MNELIHQSFQLLQIMHNEERGLFSFATRRNRDGTVNDFDTPGTLRYTINTLAGLQRAIAHGHVEWPFRQQLDRFLDLYWQRVVNAADQGLLLYVLAEEGHERTTEAYQRVASLVADESRLRGLNLQDVSWMLTGLVRHAVASGDAEARTTAERLFRFIDKHHLNKDTMLPFYRSSGWRKRFSAFGGIVYFLKSMADYAEAFHDRYADAVFQESTLQMMALQGRNGEWPWFLDASRGSVADWYPIYSVHQDSMSMLFLLPALDRGVPGAKEAITKSYRWLFGDNELRRPMIKTDPFFIHRSIRRIGAFERPRRFLRGLGSVVLNRSDRPADPSTLTVLEECRSYQLGWILYAWSPRNDFAEFTNLERLRDSSTAVLSHP